jgi:rhodanese-related sulfurtransferase
MESLVISLEEAKTLCSDKGAVFLDARSPEDYAHGHIRCAQNIPWQSFDEYLDRVFNMIPDDAWIVTYCDCETCSLSEDLAKELVSMGYEKVKVLLNGWTRWFEAGFPIEVVKNASCEKHRIS